MPSTLTCRSLSPQIGMMRLEAVRHFRLRWYLAIRLLETTEGNSG